MNVLPKNLIARGAANLRLLLKMSLFPAWQIQPEMKLSPPAPAEGFNFERNKTEQSLYMREGGGPGDILFPGKESDTRGKSG